MRYLCVALLCSAACATTAPARMTFAEAGIPLVTRLDARPAPKPKVARAVRARPKPRPVVESPRAAWPVDPVFVTSPFGWRLHPVTRQEAPHDGADFGAVLGQPVRAALEGRVTWAGRYGALGLAIEVYHGRGLVTRYGHLLAVEVELGDTVAVGDRIGLVGETGRATGPHLHFEVRAKGYPVDPVQFLGALMGRKPLTVSLNTF